MVLGENKLAAVVSELVFLCKPVSSLCPFNTFPLFCLSLLVSLLPFWYHKRYPSQGCGNNNGCQCNKSLYIWFFLVWAPLYLQGRMIGALMETLGQPLMRVWHSSISSYFSWLLQLPHILRKLLNVLNSIWEELTGNGAVRLRTVSAIPACVDC